MSSTQKAKTPILSAIILAVAAIYNLYQLFTETYVSVYYTAEDKSIISIGFKDIFAQTTGFTTQFSQHAINEPADFDSLFVEKAAFACALVGIILILIGIYSIIKKDNYTLSTTGLMLTTVSFAILWFIVHQVQSTFEEQVGTLELFFGSFYHFHSSAMNIMIVNIILGIALFIVYMIQRNSNKGEAK